MFIFNQSRVVCCIFYSLDDIQCFIDKLKFDNGRYAYIYHDKDKNKDGTDKMPHYHFYGRRQSPILQQTLAKFQKKCKENVMFENLRSTDAHFLAYFTHDECEDKVKYNPDDIIANFDVQTVIATGTSSNIVDPADILAMFDNGCSTLEIIRRYPKLIYSVSNLLKVEILVREQKEQEVLRARVRKQYEKVAPVLSGLVPLDDDVELPF